MLTEEQVRQFHEEGYLFLPETFRPEEVAVLREEAEAVYRQQRPEVWREKSGAPRTAFAAHLYNEGFGLLGRHPRMIHPVEQLFGEPVYMHQYKVNAKASFTGDVWQWHQDYGTWARDDGMPEPRAMNIAVFLDEVMPINGPLMLVPRSHTQGVLSAEHDTTTTSYPLWTLDEETVTRLVDAGGIVAPTGKPGGLLLFHGNLVHGSAARRRGRNGSRTRTSRRSCRTMTTRCSVMPPASSRRRSRPGQTGSNGACSLVSLQMMPPRLPSSRLP